MIRLIRWLAFGYILWRWLGPEPKPQFSVPQEHPLRLPGRSVFVGDRELFVRESGPPDAPPLVLIHGWATDTLFNWYKIIPLLSDRFHVIAIDQRNSGKSDYTRARYDIADVADEIAALLGMLDVGRVPLVGYSMGGMIAQEIAHRYPHLVEKLVLGGTAATVTPTTADQLKMWSLLWLGRTWDRVSKAEFSWVRQRYLTRVGAVAPVHERWVWDSYLGRDVNLYYEGGFAVARFDSRSWVGRLSVEALIVIPTEDQLVDPSLQFELASLLKHAEVLELEGARHESVLTHAEPFAEAIVEYLGDASATGAA
ncbi:MAG: alpha/beta fold hydrolase [Acidimicrobiia bacterium]